MNDYCLSSFAIDYSGLLAKSLKEGRVKVMYTKISFSGPPAHLQLLVDPHVLPWINDDEPKPLPQVLFPVLVVSLLSRKCSPKFQSITSTV